MWGLEQSEKGLQGYSSHPSFFEEWLKYPGNALNLNLGPKAVSRGLGDEEREKHVTSVTSQKDAMCHVSLDHYHMPFLAILPLTHPRN